MEDADYGSGSGGKRGGSSSVLFSNEQKFVVVDVEAIDKGVWLSMAFVTALYPSGNIVAIEEFFVDRTCQYKVPSDIQDVSIRGFWESHQEAFYYNTKRGVGISEQVSEQMVCGYINKLRRHTPHFFLVSDNPSFDVGIIDAILTRGSHPLLSQRTGDMFAQVLCTWSYRQALARLFQTRASNLFSHPNVAALLAPITETISARPIEQVVVAQMATSSSLSLLKNNNKDMAITTTPPFHTPLRDCYHILSTYFKCMDVMNLLQIRINAIVASPTTTPSGGPQQQQQQLYQQQQQYQHPVYACNLRVMPLTYLPIFSPYCGV